MSTTDTTTDIVIIDATDDTEYETDSFGKEIGKTLVISTATSAGVVAGVLLIAALLPKVQALVARRKNKKTESTEETVHDITDAPKTEN